MGPCLRSGDPSATADGSDKKQHEALRCWCIIPRMVIRRILPILLVLPAMLLHAQIGIDTHLDVMQRVLIEGKDLGQLLPDGQVDFPRLRKGGVNAPFFALYIPTYYKGG